MTDPASRTSRLLSTSPRAFLRGRRPEQFSDTTIEEVQPLDRSHLEYHLSTITSRSQEADFANFARKLAMREICPNLLPQTGPTGGGDSKVDSETYPIAKALTYSWYEGIDPAAASERWAFAFSAKAKWRAKVAADIASLAGTARGYVRAYFITNQFVRDKARAQVEDAIRKKHKIDLRILDRTWILDRVFERHHEQLAIDELRISVGRHSEARKGARDLEREAELADVEARILATVQRGEAGFELVEDCIQAGEIARALERPQFEVEGLFGRARRNAEQFGSHHQQFIAAYSYAWTVFWWFEDCKRLTELYDDLAVLATGTSNAYEVELLNNLYFLLWTAQRNGGLTEAEARLADRSAQLSREAERLSIDSDRPSTALHARTTLLLHRLRTLAASDQEGIFRELEDVARRAEGLVGYPFKALATTILELGDYLDGAPGFAPLAETLIDITARREGDVAGARMLLRRGHQQLRNKRPYEAIRTLGRSLTRLYKHESRGDVVRALDLCGGAYEQIGLLWAARGTVLLAASVATNEFWTYEAVSIAQAHCYRHMKWLEVQLGRVPQALAWHEVDIMVRQFLVKRGELEPGIAEGDMEFDACVGFFFLKSDLPQLRRLERMPDVLERVGLFNAAIALWYALGHEDQIPNHPTEPETSATRKALFRRWRDNVAPGELPDAADWSEKRTLQLRSIIVGCRIDVSAENDRLCVEIGETILAALEAFLATAVVDRAAPREPQMTIRIRRSRLTAEPVTFGLTDHHGTPHVDVACGAVDHRSISTALRDRVQDSLISLVADVCAKVFFVGTTEDLTRMIRDDMAMTRAVTFAAGYFVVTNVLGHMPKFALSDWVADQSLNTYALMRQVLWDDDDRQTSTEPLPKSEKLLVPGKGAAPQELFSDEAVRHQDIRVVSPIREALWNRAGWHGALFQTHRDDLEPPLIALMFRDQEAAEHIFNGWRSDLGTEDIENRLRLTIIRGVDKAHPAWYRVVVGSNPASALQQHSRLIAISRLLTMTPKTPDNLERFLESYHRVGHYALAPVVFPETGKDYMLGAGLALLKSDLVVRDAWRIGENDPDSVGIRADDDPIVPPNESAVPILEVLQRKRQHP